MLATDDMHSKVRCIITSIYDVRAAYWGKVNNLGTRSSLFKLFKKTLNR